jgi:hypothetical protein
MRKSRHVGVAVLFGLLVAGPSPTSGGAPKSLGGLVAASDGIVVGTIAQGTATGTSIALSIQVERAIKGKWATGAVIAAAGTISEPSPTRAITEQRGIFFLANAGTGPMRLVPAMSGHLLDEMFVFLPLPDASVPAAQPGANSTTRERLLLEILGAMEAGPTKRFGGFVDVLGEYHAAPTPAIQMVFQQWLASGPPGLAAIALQGLLGEGDVNALSRVVTDPVLRASATQAHAFNGLKWYFNNTDPAAVSSLGKLASDNSNGEDLRVAAASALARIHIKQALPILAQLLGSPDPSLRACAVGGLSMFANNVPIGSHEPAVGDWRWRTDETIAHSAMVGSDAQVQFWKNWWITNRAALSQ